MRLVFTLIIINIIPHHYVCIYFIHCLYGILHIMAMFVCTWNNANNIMFIKYIMHNYNMSLQIIYIYYYIYMMYHYK